MAAPSAPPLWNVPNLLSLSRLPLAVGLFACIAAAAWPLGLLLLLLATLTDWLDGWWARRYGQESAVGRALDPLTDKVLVGGAFIYLVRVEEAGIDPWMTTVVLCRELLVTGLRGMVEAAGKKFGADWFGKLKMALQCAVLIGVFVLQSLRMTTLEPRILGALATTQAVLLYAMLAATVGSGVQYVVKAVRLLR